MNNKFQFEKFSELQSYSGMMAPIVKNLTYCLVRHGTPLNHSRTTVFRKFPLSDKILEVDASNWDGLAPFPHCFYDKHPIDTPRIYPHIPAYDKGYPSVTTLISCISPKEGLYTWQEDQIKRLGLAGFREKNQQRMKTSKDLHSLLESCIKEFCIEGKIRSKEKIFQENAEKKGYEISDGYLQSILPMFHGILGDLKEECRDQICCEQMVYNHRLIYRGKFDAVLPINGKLTLLDWKGCTAGSAKSQEDSDCVIHNIQHKIQLAAYIGAINSDPEFGHLQKIKQAAIVTIYESGREAELQLFGRDEIEQAYEQFKGLINALWHNMATTKPKINGDGKEVIDFCYKPKPAKSKKP